jgi:hypothetical protein
MSDCLDGRVADPYFLYTDPDPAVPDPDLEVPSANFFAKNFESSLILKVPVSL